MVLGEVCGRVKSSKRSARRGWCMWRFVIEESLLWFVLLVWVCLLRWGRRRGVPFWWWCCLLPGRSIQMDEGEDRKSPLDSAGLLYLGFRYHVYITE